MSDASAAAISRYPVPKLEDLPEDIWDVGAIAAFFALSNRMADLTAMRPNDEFHLIGRVPKTR